MISLMLAGLLTAVGILIVLIKLSYRAALYYEVPIDVMLTVAIPLLFAGTFSGLMTAIFAGIFVSLGLKVLRIVTGNQATPDLIASFQKRGWLPA